MEISDGGIYSKTTTKILGVAAGTIGAATEEVDALLFVTWDLYQIADAMGSGECQNW